MPGSAVMASLYRNQSAARSSKCLPSGEDDDSSDAKSARAVRASYGACEKVVLAVYIFWRRHSTSRLKFTPASRRASMRQPCRRVSPNAWLHAGSAFMVVRAPWQVSVVPCASRR